MLHTECICPHLVYIYRFYLLYEDLAEKIDHVISLRIVFRTDILFRFQQFLHISICCDSCHKLIFDEIRIH
jgi:hypothetical protein